jgi:RNA-directed DNA polymerase
MSESGSVLVSTEESGYIFLPDSYGYRPRKSALDAVGVTRQRCWKYDWVLEFDIRGLLDAVSYCPQGYQMA